MAKQTFTTGSVLTATQMNNLQANDYNWDLNGQTASYVLVAADAGKRVQMNAAGSTTITVNTGLFTAGDTVLVQNIGAGTCTVTAGTATVNKATNASLALAQYQGGTLYFVSASSAIFFPFDVGTGSPAFKGCALYSTVDVNINDNTLTDMTFNSEYYDTDNFHSTSTNTARITIPAGLGGKYLVTGQIRYSAGATGNTRAINFRKNGAGAVGQFRLSTFGSGSDTQVFYCAIMDLVATDYITLTGYQNQGSALNMVAGSGLDNGTWFQAAYLGA